jgi:hypothetical protein
VKRLLVILYISVMAGAALAMGGLLAGCKQARSAQQTPAPSTPAPVADVPTVIPTKAVQTGTLAIPGKADTISLIECYSDKLYISSDANGCGLHCYSLADSKPLWSAHLADYQHRVCEEGVIKQATAYELVFSSDGRTVFAGVSGEETCEPIAIKLVALDCATGKQLSELEDSEYRKLTAASFGGRNILIAVGRTNVLILDQANLKTVLLEYKLPHPGPDPNDPDQFWSLPPAPGCCAWDEAGGVLYLGLLMDKQVARLELQPDRKSWSYHAQYVRLTDAPNQMLLLPERGQLAVALYKLPQLLLLDARTLTQAERREWLQYTYQITLVDGMLLSWSHASDKEREQMEKSSVYEDMSRVVLSPLAGGASRIIELPGMDLSHLEAYMPGQLLLGAHGHWDMVEGVIDGQHGGGMATAHGSLALLNIATGKTAELMHFENGLISIHRDPVSSVIYAWDYADSGPTQKASPELKLLRLE